MYFNPYILQQMMRGSGGGICIQQMPQVRQNPNAAYNKQTRVRNGGYLAIKVKNSNPTEARPYVILDALGLFQQQENIDFPNADVTVEGLSKDYPSVLRNLLSSRWVISKMNLQISAGAEAQFDRAIDIYQDDIGSNKPKLMQSINPSAGLNSYQQQENRIEVPVNLIYTSDKAMVSTIEPNSELIIRLFVDKNFELR